MAKHIPHVFVSDQDLNSLSLTDDPFHHLINVLRFKTGYNFFLLNNQGLKAHCRITEIKKQFLNFEVLDKTYTEKNNYTVNLFQAITKIETFEEILDKSVQMGVNSITPVITDNVSVSVDIFKKKYSRFNKILKSSSEQSQRFYLPVLNDVIDLKNFHQLNNPDNTFIAYEKSDTPLKNVLNNFTINEINLFCGSEGGFSDSESKFLMEKFKVFSLGKNILRAETAVLSALANIIYQLDFN